MGETKAARARRATAPDAIEIMAPEPRITGKVEVVQLKRVKPNGWNPNRMTELQVASTRDGLQREGWLASHALLIWRTDDHGHERNLIIDGEHRWRIASDIGFTKGPMVFLDGISERRAKQLTVELDNKRGRFDETALRDLILDIGVEDGLAFQLGFDDETFAALLESHDVLPPGDFSEVTIDAHTDYTCPKCGYEWSGQPSAKKKDE